jgi:gliding motility-associated-like protein
MKKTVTNLLYTSIVVVVYILSALNAVAQNSPRNDADTKKSIRAGQQPVVNAGCGDMGAENGWSAWKASTGSYQNGAIIFDNPQGVAPRAPRFAMTSGGATDPCTPGSGGPVLPMVAPGFGNSSIRLGEPRTNGLDGGCDESANGGPQAGCVERLMFPFTVGPTDTNFIYSYAIVLENPSNIPHNGKEVPYAEIYILAGNNIVPCSHQKYTGDTTGTGTNVQPGFYAARCTGPQTNGQDVVYKPWTTVGINLNGYVGQTLTVVITNVDCARGGHFCHSYWDFACPPVSGNDPLFCIGNSTTLTGPISDQTNPYTYKWYVNGMAYGSPIATSISITPTPKVGDVFAVRVHQSSGCDFWVPYRPQPLTITPDFTSVGGCRGIVNFTDKSSTPDGSPMIKWDWNFGGGTPNTSNIKDPSGIHYPPGTYSVTLIVTSSAGCIDTVVLPVIITTTPIAAFASNVVCFNNPTTFKDFSTGTPLPKLWDWDFGDGNKSTSQNPLHTYGAPGSFTVTLVATDPNGCKDTIKHPVFINPLPLANFTSDKVCFGNPTCFSNHSTISSGKIVKLSWVFGDPISGASNTDTVPSPCHTYASIKNYNVTLTVTSDSGCLSTVVLPVVFNPPPVALFSSSPVCLNGPTKFISSSTSSATDTIARWNWDFGDGTTSTQANPTHFYATAGSFTATLAITTVGGCKDTVDKPIVVHAPPQAYFSKPDSGCAPLTVGYTDLSTSGDGNVNGWQWSFPGGKPAMSTVKNPQNIEYQAPGSYSVSLIATTIYGCTDTIELPMIEVYPWPKAEFCVAPTSAPATDPVFNFCDMWSTDVVKWSWNFGDGSTLDSSSTDPVHSYSATVNQNDFYTKQICLNVQNQHGCWANVCHEVKLIPEFVFYIPNTFTPNGDNYNEMFYGKCRGVKEYNIWVFDRWGNQLWDCHHSDKNTNWDNDQVSPKQEGLASYCQWDGIVVQGGLDMGGDSRKGAQEDVYVWKVQLTDIFNKRHTYIGHVNIVK